MATVREKMQLITLLRRKLVLFIISLRLIYERIGTYMRKNLQSLYVEEDRRLNDKVKQLYNVYKTDISKFNEIMQSDFKSQLQPNKSLQIMKVFFRCQLPYEMFVSCLCNKKAK